MGTDDRHAEHLERLHEAANRLHSAETVEECYDITIEAAVTILGFDWCTLAAPAPEGDVFELVAVSAGAPLEVGHRPFGLDEGLAGQVYQTKSSSIVDDVQSSEAGEPTDDAIRAAVTVPIGDWGIFQAVATTPGAFDDQDRKHAELLVASMLTAIERIEQAEELRDRQRELERQNERLAEFTSVVSHDLRNPLNVAEARLELAREDCDSEHLDGVGDALDRMHSLIADLLTLARGGDEVGEPQRVDLKRAATDAWRNVPTQDATLEVATDQAIRADRSRLQQLLENLFRNAVEHGGESVEVRVGSLPEGFYVEDDGPGIPEDAREDVFDAGYSTAESGTGFGLSIVKQVADAHGWDVGIADGTAGGARFGFTNVTGEG